MTGASPYLLVAAVVILMEGVAWGVHRFVMHGPAWFLHRSHHEAGHRRIEANDVFAALFATIATALIAVDLDGRGPAYWIGIGMSVYGALYALLHDGLAHRRWPMPRGLRWGYIDRLVRAHHLHHARSSRDGCVSFGFLYAPPTSRLARRLRARRGARSR